MINIGEIFKIGRISSVDKEKMAARVTFPDRQNVVTDFLPIIVPFAGDNQFYYLPKVQEQVLCLFDPNNNKGFIIGTFFNAVRTPKKTGDILYLKLGEMTLLYDKEKSELSVSGAKDISLSADKVSIKGVGVTINDTEFGGGGINKSGDMDISVAGSIKLSGKTVTFESESDINVNYNGRLLINGKKLEEA